MKGNTTGLVLLGLTLVSAIFTTVISIMTIGAMNQQLAMQKDSQKVQAFRQMATALIEESAIYSRKNPTIIPVLEKHGIKPTPAGTDAPRK